VNNTVINEGPQTQIIEKASGRKVHAVPVRELRHRTEAEVVAKQRIAPAADERKAQPPVQTQIEPRERNLDAERRAKDAKNAELDAQRNARAAEKKAHADAERRAKESDRQAQVDAQRNAPELERKAKLDPDRGASEAKKPEAGAPRNAKALENKKAGSERAKKAEKPQRASERGANRAQDASEQDGTNTLKKAQKQKGKE